MKKFQPFKTLLAMGLCASFLLILYGLYKISHLPPGTLGDEFPTRIYAAPFEIRPETPLSLEALEKRLKRLGYKSVAASPVIPGEYYRETNQCEIYLKGFSQPFWEAPEQKIQISLDRKGKPEIPGTIFLEPELIAEISGPKKIQREAATYSEIPDHLIQAVISIEDRRFFEHHGVDLRSFARALLVNLIKGKFLQGGSTLTQQLVKNMFLVPQKALWRKLAETVLALYLETRYSKQEILTLYLNQVYWGQNGPVSIAGIKAASRFYFNKSIRNLTVSECALLAGLLRSPLKYSPFRNVESALARRNFVLKSMLKWGNLSPQEYEKAIREPLNLNLFPALPTSGKADYFISELLGELVEKYSEQVVFRHGLTVFTTLDPLIQEIAQKDISRLATQGALLTLDPYSGAVRALVGGRVFSESQFNRATQAKRQPGSAFKPFVYGAALRGHDRVGKPFTLAYPLLDSPQKYPTPEGDWEPKNFDEVYHGTVTFRQAISLSFNLATVDLAAKVGLKPIIRYAKELGIDSPLKEELGLALGSSEVTLLELVAAYAPFANGGNRIEPYLIEGILDIKGASMERHTPERTQVLKPGEAYLMTSLLESVVKEGTAKSLKLLGFSYPAAGKTGTTSKEQDAWFVGYTPYLLTGVWVGEDQPKPIQATGATAALPIWAKVMIIAMHGLPPQEFQMPEDVLSLKVDPTTGLRAVSGCPQKIKEFFLSGTEPATDCSLHPAGIKGWFHRLF
ncbi:MAG: PBP1A family penicillin-binding protein [Elusimicrobia bacterium]|nr:PBP1A family penicillin-binding protein [Elusimicrobiota bacterium]